MERTMAVEVRMPKLGLTMERGVVTGWLKKEGDPVSRGEPIVEITTEKIANQIDADGAGTLGRILVQEGEEAPVGALLGLILQIGEDPSSLKVGVEAEPALAIAAAAPSFIDSAPARISDGDQDGGIKASPVARKLAQQYGVDLSHLKPQVEGGRIGREDVLAFVAAMPAQAEPSAISKPGPTVDTLPAEHPMTAVRAIPMAGMRKVIADHLMASLHSSAQLTVAIELDVTELVTTREQIIPGFQAAIGLRPSYTDILMVLVSKALLLHPILNSTISGNEILLHGDVNMGIAVALENGLIVPVIPGTHAKSLGEITRARTELVQKAKEGRLSPDEMAGGTFTITNPGTPGADISTPILNSPQNAILGVGRFVKKPAVLGDEICVRQMCWFSVTFDHRVSDGVPVIQFFETLNGMLQDSRTGLGLRPAEKS
jgi:pyruvate dehydrogenase E2 component (dihydrolipoamide acetyltransferase)